VLFAVIRAGSGHDGARRPGPAAAAARIAQPGPGFDGMLHSIR